jgi:hypothetical protein
VSTGGSWKQREQMRPMGREDPGDSHPPISEWEGVGVSLPGSIDL